MIPVLYPSTETSFTTNGLGGLPDAISCVVTEQRNTQGGYYLEMEYPIDGLHFDLLAPERIIYAAPSMGNTPQPFRISRITRPINGIVHIEAPHICAELQKLTSWGVDTGTNIQGMIYNQFYRARQLGQTVPFWCETDITVDSDVTFSHPEPTTLADILLGAEGSVLDVVGGEYEWDGYHIILHRQRGVDSGLEIRYGVNMSDLEAETDATELVTAVIPFWKGTVNEQDVVVIGDMCEAGNASAYAYVRCVPLDVTQQFEETDTQPTKAQVTAKGQAFINSTSRRLLQTSIRVSYEPTTSGIGERLINLCDTVRVVYPDLNVSSISKVVETRFNVLIERYDELTIGTIRNNIVDTIAGLISGGSGSGGSSSGGGGSSAVTSVNGMTGAVVLTASDVDALPSTYTAPVTSVNGMTGAVKTQNVYSVVLNADGTVNTFDSALTYSAVSARIQNQSFSDQLVVTWGNSLFTADADEKLSGANGDVKFICDVEHDGIQRHMIFTLTSANVLQTTLIETYSRVPAIVWEVADVTQGLIALNTNISSTLAWQLTGLNLSPFKRIKIYAKAGRKTGALSADSSITPASIIEMSMDDRAKENVSQNVFIGSSVVQNPNDANRLGIITCAVSGDKTKFAVLRATTLYGTAATSNTDAYPYVFKIEGYYD